MSWIKHSETFIKDLKLFQARWDHYHNKNLGIDLDAIVLNAPETANVVALTKDNKIVMVSQYRFGTQNFSLELPGGIVEPNEPLLEAVQRELIEETGYTGKNWSYLGHVYSNPVIMNNRCHHYLVKEVEKTHALKLDSTEEITVELIDVERMRREIFDLVVHPHTLSALMRVLSVDLKIDIDE